MKLKNKTDYGYKLNKMNDETYELRRKVIDIIYELKKIVDLPRIEVRIVNGGDVNICGYAYCKRNIIHISERYSKMDKNVLTYLVCHELVHAVIGFGHNEECYLMCSTMVSKITMSKTIKIFKSYF